MMLPLLLSGFRRTDSGIGQSALTQICIAAMMTTPALAALVVLRWIHRPTNVRVAIGLTRPRPFGKLVRMSLLAVAVPVGLQLAALAISAASGKYRFDLVNFSGFRTQFAPDTVGQTGVPTAAIVMFAGTLVLGMIAWLPMFFGEELGWQGYLLPRLAPLGRWPSLVLTSVAVALWHLPTLIMGGQYPGHSWTESVGYMLVGAVLLVPIFCWLRIRTGSVWPAVLAHCAVSNVNIRLVWLFADADVPIDPLHVGLNGWPGWIVMATLLAILTATGQFRYDTEGRPS